MEGEKYPEIQDMYNEFSALYNLTYSRTQRRSAGSDGIPFRDEFIFVEMAKKATQLAEQVEGNLSNSTVRFLLSGLMETKKGQRNVNLSNTVDDYAPKRFTIPRWQTEMTPEDQQRLRDIGQLASQLNRLMDTKGSDIVNWLKDSFNANECLKDMEDRLLSIPQVITTIAPELADRAKAIAEEPYRQARRLSEEYTDNLANAPGMSSVALLQRFSASLLGTADSIESLVLGIDDKLIKLLEEVPSDPKIQAFRTTYESCREKLQADKNKIMNIAGRLSTMFGNSKGAARAAAKLDEKVKRLSYDEIPEKVRVNLDNTGRRANGDVMIIRAILEAPGVGGAPPVSKIIDERNFKLQQIGMYSIIKPMLLLADPIGSGDNIDLEGKRFQFAPSYSVLFKFGSRTSKAYNEIWQPGLGVNFGALDFNTDAVPEFGAALEFTILRDYFSVGYGYNFGADARYFMVGFRLPISAVPLPLFNEAQP